VDSKCHKVDKYCNLLAYLAAALNDNLAATSCAGLGLLLGRLHCWLSRRIRSGNLLAPSSVEALALLADAYLSFNTFLAVAVTGPLATSVRKISSVFAAALGGDDATGLNALSLALRSRKWRWLESWRGRRTGGGGGRAWFGREIDGRNTVGSVVAVVLGTFTDRYLVREILAALAKTGNAGVGLQRRAGWRCETS